MTEGDAEYNQSLVFNRVDDAVDARPDSPKVLSTAELGRAGMARVRGQPSDGLFVVLEGGLTITPDPCPCVG